ncbi:hypothetical protein, partial [Herbaspirillum sp. CAH-3]|uniref:hypothetical protein n=1 Tax=Herbaspirillum sp. CAH-3 TaxID=2605746 RepID=UPI0013934E4B
LKQMFLDLKELGYEGSYDRVAAFGRRWKVGQMERVKSASKSTAVSLLAIRMSLAPEICSRRSRRLCSNSFSSAASR